jgi:hypothetical protein
MKYIGWMMDPLSLVSDLLVSISADLQSICPGLIGVHLYSGLGS